FYGSEDWQREVRASLSWHVAQRVHPTVVGVTMASSDRLVKDDEILAQWMKVARQIRALEMESAGVYLAALGRGTRRSVPAMSIRAISDVVGFRRGERGPRYAGEAAAAFARAFVRSGYVTPRAEQPGGLPPRAEQPGALPPAPAPRVSGDPGPPPGA